MVHTDHDIQACRPDTVVKEKGHGHIWIIDMAVPGYLSIENKREKYEKYQDPVREMQRLQLTWKNAIPVVVVENYGKFEGQYRN